MPENPPKKKRVVEEIPLAFWPHYRLPKEVGADIRRVHAVIVDDTEDARLWRSYIPEDILKAVRKYMVRLWPEALALSFVDPDRFMDWTLRCPSMVELCMLMLRYPDPAIPEIFSARWGALLLMAELPFDEKMLNLMLKMPIHTLALFGISRLQSIAFDPQKRPVLEQLPSLTLGSLTMAHDLPAAQLDLHVLQLMAEADDASSARIAELYNFIRTVRPLLGLTPDWPFQGLDLSVTVMEATAQQLKKALLEQQKPQPHDLLFPPAPFPEHHADSLHLRPIASLRALLREECDAQTPLSHLLSQLLSGGHAAYQILQPERGGVILIRINNAWNPIRFYSTGDAILSMPTRLKILNWLNIDPAHYPLVRHFTNHGKLPS